jgi:hypothetical protein
MKPTTKIQNIVDNVLPGLLKGEATLEAILAAYPEQAETLRPLLESALWLQARQPQPELRPGYIQSSRNRLEAQVATHPFSAWQLFWRRPTPQRYALQSFSYVLLIFSLLLVINSLYLASRLALPGDPLYSAKLGFEAIQLALTLDAEAEARLHIQFTQQRTEEIVQLVLEEDYLRLPAAANRLDTQINRAVTDLDALQARDSAHSAELVRAMEKMLLNESFILTVLRDTDPSFAYAGLNQAIDAATRGLTALQN